jgi:ketosteroid isomerase-like protein
VLTSQIELHRREGSSEWRLDDVRGRGNRVAVTFSWRGPDGSRARWAQLLTLSNGKIAGMRDYADPARAIRAVGA